MEIVFLNRFERALGKSEVERGQVFIGEYQGIWSVGWHSIPDQGEDGRMTWYEGTSWEELLASFRYGVAGQMKLGFRPLLDGMLEDSPFWERRQQFASVLQCYADRLGTEELIAPLRQWRRAKAAEEKRSAYLVATNRELRLIAVFVPRTLEELEQLPGFGKLKVEKYGPELLEQAAAMPRDHSFPLQWVEEAVTEDQLAAWLFLQKEEKYGKDISLVQEKKKLLTGIRQGSSIAELEKELGIPRRMLVERIDRLDEEGYDVLPLVARELAEVAAEEIDQVETAMQELGDRYLKPIYQRLYAADGAPSGAAGQAERQYEKLRMIRIRFRRSGAKSAVS
ncbi:HRDC domain-containing protein [Cohnella fermenti]|uniref:Aldolase n=1 Tax=Cohnella fermenti TaxID=2565925 RepID=A0A4S4BMN8_9BACL|nr:HRDC domain-containing protein [Cohnella fermenti]THF76103.1 aldolase [Cohnella fermenti]